MLTVETKFPIGNYPEYRRYDINLPECGLRYVPTIYNVSFENNTCFKNDYLPQSYYDLTSNNLHFAKKRTENRVYDGHSVGWGEAAWAVEIITSWHVLDISKCTGTLITFEWVLTGAHCARTWYV